MFLFSKVKPTFIISYQIRRRTGLIDVPVPVVDNIQSPPAFCLFAPIVNAQERPVIEVGPNDVPRTFEQQYRRGPCLIKENFILLLKYFNHLKLSNNVNKI